MAYDPNDPKDKEIVDGLVLEATTRLKTKNEELIGELRKAREGKVDPALVERLERDLETSQQALEDATKAKTKAEGDLKKTTERADASEKRANALAVSTALAKVMTENKIAPQFQDGVEAMFGSKATVKVVDGVETVMVGEKTLGDTLKEFVGSDKGKHYVAAGNNGGGGSNGGGADRGAKTMTREAFGGLDAQAKMDFSKGGGTLTDS